MSGSLGTGIPITLKCSTCKKHRVTRLDGDRYAHPGELWRTGKTRPYKGSGKYSRSVSRLTRITNELWCSVCGEHMWSAHSDAERKPLVVKVDLDGKEE